MDLSKLELVRLAPDLDGAVNDQVSHGLNLVLELKNPLAMPILLGKIRQTQRKIAAGLGELNFVHFARFLPTYDNSALQVITEFDGPLDPYVLDFAIEIGDIFDILLSFTKGTEHIVPIAEHPDDFLAFVIEHNTVTVPGTKPRLEWPLYAAYPDVTVLDIVGPRVDLPIAKSDRWPTPVERHDVQGNILRGFGAARVRHFVLTVLDAPKARAWLAGRATPDAVSAPSVPRVTSYSSWAPGSKPKLMLNLGMTFSGMTALGIRKQWRDRFPEAFRQGALQRAKDNFDINQNDPAHWWLGGPAQAASIHVMVSLYHAVGCEAEFEQAATALTTSLEGGGLQLLAHHDAIFRDGRSWFGYIDSIANPRIAVPCPEPGERDSDLQPAATPGEFVLGAQYKNIYGGSSLGDMPEALATNGSFCAVRVLAQDTNLFAETLRSEGGRLGVNSDWLAAKLMGRWYEGAPLSLHTASPPKNPTENGRNNFDYAPSYEYPGTAVDHFGKRCPVGAHIRRINPRTSRVAGARYARRLMRRGMHYEIVKPKGEHEVGLFGLFMCADLERQFEFIQRQWINGDRFAAGLRGTRDPFVGTPPAAGHRFEIPMDSGPPLEVRVPQVVHTKGSLYLFMPGLEALRKLDHFATADPAAAMRPAITPNDNDARPALPADTPAESVRPNPADVALVELLTQFQDALKDVGATLTKADLLDIATSGVAEPIAPSMTSTVSPSGLFFNPRRRDFQIDPYPVYAEFRARERVHYSPLFDGWFVFGYDDVLSVCEDDNSFSAAKLGTKEVRGLFTLDDPQHAQVRKKVALAWSQGAVNAGTYVRDSINRTLGSIGSRECFDLVDDLARPLPRDVYFDILGGAGIDPNIRLELDQLARTVMKHHDHTMDDVQQWVGKEAGAKLAARLGLMLVESLRPGSSLKGSFLAYLAREVDWLGGPLDPKVAVLTLLNLTVAGYMSVEFLLATGIRRLLMDGATFWDVLKKRPTILPTLLHEVRRTSHALSVIDRFAKVELKLSGVLIPKGARVFGVLASANRDESVYGNTADVFDPNRRPPRRHLGLGAGTHECMGRHLEDLITASALQYLVAQLPNLRMESNAQPPWFENFYFRSFDHLKVSMR